MRRDRLWMIVLLWGLLGPAADGRAGEEAKPYVTTRVLAMGLAQRLALAAAGDCRRRGYQVTAAVVDRGGNLLALVRDPLAGPHTVETARRKAAAAATFQAPTSSMMKESEALRFIPGVILLGGGVPVRVGGHLYGAVGVSGAPPEKEAGDIDEACARAGLEAIRESLEFAD